MGISGIPIGILSVVEGRFIWQNDFFFVTLQQILSKNGKKQETITAPGER
jgi:hypothetical protein